MEKSSIQGLLEQADYECRSYSGRGMMGKECLSVSTDKDVFAVIADLLYGIPSMCNDEEDFVDYVCDVENAVRNVRTGQMGKQGIMVYFPKIEYVGNNPISENKEGKDMKRTAISFSITMFLCIIGSLILSACGVVCLGWYACFGVAIGSMVPRVLSVYWDH